MYNYNIYIFIYIYIYIYKNIKYHIFINTYNIIKSYKYLGIILIYIGDIGNISYTMKHIIL